MGKDLGSSPMYANCLCVNGAFFYVIYGMGVVIM